MKCVRSPSSFISADKQQTGARASQEWISREAYNLRAKLSSRRSALINVVRDAGGADDKCCAEGGRGRREERVRERTWEFLPSLIKEL